MGSARRDTTCVAAASNGLSGQSDRRTLQPSRKHRHRLHAVPRSVRSPRNRFYRFAAVGAQSRGCSETVSREAVAHSSAMPTSSRPSYGCEAAVRRSQSSWPARAGFQEVNVAQAAQGGWKPLGQNATRTKQACAPDIAKDRRPMPLSGQRRRLPLGAVCPTRSAGRVATPIRRRGIRRC